MATGPRYSVKFRRRRESRTNYKKRLKLLQAKLPRLVVRKSNKYILIQIAEFTKNGDKIIMCAHSSELKNFGWKFSLKNIPAAYLTGLLAAKKSAGKVKETILDIGLYSPTKGAKIFATLKGAIDGGLKINYSGGALPSDDRISGKHIADFKKASVPENFEQAKQKILELKP